jgi:predicted  nucleic acid-binding Zn-ribbon protein
MISELEALVKLQEIDIRISDFVNSKEKFPETIATLEAIVKKSNDAAEAFAKKRNAILNNKKTEENKISEAKAHLDKSEDILNTIKTNREYDAIHTQIENFKHIVSEGDAKLKVFDSESEKLQESIDAAASELEKIKTENEPQIAEIKGKMATINASVEQETAERNKIVGQIPKQLLRTYEHILNRIKNGKVLSFVNNETKTCSVCHKILEAQLINEIRKANSVIICQNCGSIFIWEENKEAQV